MGGGKGVAGLAAVALVSLLSLSCGAVAASATVSPRFGWFTPHPAPAGWKRLSLPAGGAVLSFPTSMAPIHGDPESISVAKKDASGRIVMYLNVTPKQGNERLDTWPAFRLAHIREESGPPVHEYGQALGLRFLAGKGTCVMDDYFSRGRLIHFREIACFVQGRRSAGVLVAAAPMADWAEAAPVLERAVSSFRVG